MFKALAGTLGLPNHKDTVSEKKSTVDHNQGHLDVLNPNSE
jgi:hypothetical protein